MFHQVSFSYIACQQLKRRCLRDGRFCRAVVALTSTCLGWYFAMWTVAWPALNWTMWSHIRGKRRYWGAVEPIAQVHRADRIDMAFQRACSIVRD